MFFSFKIEKPIKKLFTFALILFTSGTFMSAMSMRKERSNSDEDNIEYYDELMRWIDEVHANMASGTNKSLRGIKVFIRKEDNKHCKNIIKLYFCDKSNENWEEVIVEKTVKESFLPSHIQKKIQFVKQGYTIEITDMIFK